MRKLTAAALAIAGIMVIARMAGAPTDDLAAPHRQVVQLYQAAKFAEAIPIVQSALALGERLRGPDHPDVGTSLHDLALLYGSQHRYAEPNCDVRMPPRSPGATPSGHEAGLILQWFLK